MAGAAVREDAEDPRMLAAQFELLQRELRGRQQQLEDLQDALAQTQQAAATVRSLSEASAPKDTLVPIGAGLHLRARVDPADPVLVPLGAGYATEDTLAGAADLLEKRAAQLSTTFQQVSQETERIARTAGALNERLMAAEQA